MKDNTKKDNTKKPPQKGNAKFRKRAPSSVEPAEVKLVNGFYLFIYPEGVTHDKRGIPIEVVNPHQAFIQKMRWPGNYVALNAERRKEMTQQYPDVWRTLINELGRLRTEYFHVPPRRKTYLTQQPDTNKFSNTWVKIKEIKHMGLDWYIYERKSPLIDGVCWYNFKVVLLQSMPRGSRRAFNIGWNGDELSPGGRSDMFELSRWVPPAHEYLYNLMKDVKYRMHAPSKRDNTKVYWACSPPVGEGWGWPEEHSFDITTSYEDTWRVYVKMARSYTMYRLWITCLTGRQGRGTYNIGWSVKKGFDFDCGESRTFKEREPELFVSLDKRFREFLGDSPEVHGTDIHVVSRRKYIEGMRFHKKWSVDMRTFKDDDFILAYYRGKTHKRSKKNVALICVTKGALKYKYELYYKNTYNRKPYEKFLENDDYEKLKEHHPNVLKKLETLARKTSTFDHL